MNQYIYYTDGAATMINKNGQYLRQAGGWAYICLKNGEITNKQSGGCPLTTNNEMELYAIYASLRDFMDNSSSGDCVEICSDSGYSIDIYQVGSKLEKTWLEKIRWKTYQESGNHQGNLQSDWPNRRGKRDIYKGERPFKK